MKKQRRYCPFCATPVKHRIIENRKREYCRVCDYIFYHNPLPIVSAVVVNSRREVLLVLRDREPRTGLWCLPSGFVESNESVEDAALRELKEETGINGRILRLLDTHSHYNEIYGDIIWVSFEVHWESGRPVAGDDAREVRFFSVRKLPDMAFTSNTRAIRRYLQQVRDLWAMQDSFRRLEHGKSRLLSDPFLDIVARDAHIITENWVDEVLTHHSTPNYAHRPREQVYARAHYVISQFRKWLAGTEKKRAEIWTYYFELGKKRREEGYRLSEVLSALSLTRKHIFAHVLGQGGLLNRVLEIYSSLEFISRVNLFFDKATYHITRGYEFQSVTEAD